MMLFKALFGLVNEDIANLSADDVEEIIFEFGALELTIEVVLKEEEEVSECGETEMENIVIEIEGEYEELTDDDLAGDIEFVGEVENDDETVSEFTYAGAFGIENGVLTLTLQGELDDDETDEIELRLEK
ncbi:MAG: hypothetical protein HC880_19635 [Bacteroidia bacterium]|nr:hypothetical protein [Bacteroidia bacterium]